MQKIFFIIISLFLLASCTTKDPLEGKWIHAKYDLPTNAVYDPNLNTYLESTIEIEGNTVKTSFVEMTLEGHIDIQNTFKIVKVKDTADIRFYFLKDSKTDNLTVLPAMKISDDKIRFESFFIKVSGEFNTNEKIEELIKMMTDKTPKLPMHGEIYRSPLSYNKIKKLPTVKYPMTDIEYLEFLKKCNQYLLNNTELIKKAYYCPRTPAHLDEVKEEALIGEKLNPYTSMFIINAAGNNFFSEPVISEQKNFWHTFDSIYVVTHPRK